MGKSRKFKEQKPVEDIEKHYTSEALVKKLVELVPYSKTDFVVDCASGRNMVFFNNFKTDNKEFCEIDLQKDFFEFNKPVDWFITNPPFHLCWKFIDHASTLASKGFAFVLSSNSLLSLTPRRLTILRNRGFEITSIHIFNVKKWFGRYYFVVFEKNKKSIINWLEGVW